MINPLVVSRHELKRGELSTKGSNKWLMYQEAANLLASQWKSSTEHKETVSLFSEDMVDLFKEFSTRFRAPSIRGW